MELPFDLTTYTIALLAGLIAGFVNALAFSGSFFTLPALLFMGLAPHLANGTNRVGILLASVVSVLVFHRGEKLPTRGVGWMVIPAAIGSALGAMVAVDMDSSTFTDVLAGLMLVCLVLLVLQPKKFLAEHSGGPVIRKNVATVGLFLVLGAYGGFIQAGVGIFLLFALVLYNRYDLTAANGVKNLMVLVFTIPALVVFAMKGDVDWSVGLLLAFGQCLGAFIASRFAVLSPNANRWIRRLLILLLAATVLKLLGLLDW